MARLPLFLVIALVAGTAPAETLTLRYAWSPGLHADVVYEATRSRTLAGETDEQRISGRYSMRTESAPAGLRVRFDDFEVHTREGGPAGGPQVALQDFLQRAGSMLPDLLVSEEGRVVGVEGMDAVREKAQAGAGPVLAPLPADVRARVEAVLEQMFSPERLEAGARNQWQRDVEGWLGVEVESGRRYQQEGVGQVPALGNASVPVTLAYRMVGRTACESAAAREQCVILELTSELEPEGAMAALRETFDRLAAQAGAEIRVESVELESTMRLVTDPDTLIPRSLHLERLSSVTVTRDGATQTSTQNERRNLEYRYR
jgi:hypothetical protein